MEDEADWRDWISNGESERAPTVPTSSPHSCVGVFESHCCRAERNPYVPSNPDVIYKEEWEGWDDFLNGPVEDASVVLKEGYVQGKWLRGPLSEKDDEDA